MLDCLQRTVHGCSMFMNHPVRKLIKWAMSLSSTSSFHGHLWKSRLSQSNPFCKGVASKLGVWPTLCDSRENNTASNVLLFFFSFFLTFDYVLSLSVLISTSTKIGQGGESENQHLPILIHETVISPITFTTLPEWPLNVSHVLTTPLQGMDSNLKNGVSIGSGKHETAFTEHWQQRKARRWYFQGNSQSICCYEENVSSIKNLV